MSMPSFPPDGAGLTREEALTMIIASIAMEELALSHILNAEEEKLRYILGLLPGSKPCAGPREVLAVNKSVTALVEAVTQNQILLKNKLDRVLDHCPCPEPPPRPPEPSPCPPPCPPKPRPPEPAPCPPHCPPKPFPCPPPCPPKPCPPKARSVLQLSGQREGALWGRDSRLAWRQRVCHGEALRWDPQAPCLIRLDPKESYALQYTLNVCALEPWATPGALVLRQTPKGAFTEPPPLHVSPEAPGCPQSLVYSALLFPRMTGGCEAELSLVLQSGGPLCVEQAELTLRTL